MKTGLIEQLDALLPQTQCTRCGYEGCGPYARAIAYGKADINRCPPGGQTVIRRLAALLGRPVRTLDPACGVEKARHVAFIDEAQCIGCTLCIRACPVDAILGAPRQMHTVLTELCSGCELCLAPCPVDCIVMQPAAGADALWNRARARAARTRFEARKRRLARERAGSGSSPSGAAAGGLAFAEQEKHAAIQAAIERARTRRAAAPGAANPRQEKRS